MKEARWRHPGGKLRELGPHRLTEAELLAILIGTGIQGRTSETLAKELLDRSGSLKGLMGRTLSWIGEVKGVSDVKAIRIAATFEIARRLAGGA